MTLTKNPSFSLIISTILLFLCGQNESANILGIFHIPSKSHHILGSKLLRTLAEKGHQVTMVSPYPFDKKIPNYTDVSVEGIEEVKERMMGRFLNKNHELSWLEKMKIAIKGPAEMVEFVLNDPKVRELEKQHFDLVIQIGLFSDPLLGIAHKLNAPVIYFSSLGAVPQLNSLTGNPSPLSYVQMISLFKGEPSTTQMTFLQRLVNTLLYLFYETVSSPFIHDYSQKTLSHYFPDAPPLSDLLNNVSLVFLNTHYSIEKPRPYVPNMVSIGGFHIEPARELSPDLKKFLDEAANGAILLSFGSNVKMGQMEPNKLRAIVNTLGKLPQRVLLKSEVDIPDLPANILLGKWLPQSDILAHPNLVLFISHGGLLSTTEAVYHGVPILGIPFFGDQQMNIAGAVSNGYAVALDAEDLTEEAFEAVVHKILSDPTYTNNIKLKSSLLRNQAVHPLDLAVFWVEHVLEHKGAKHLQNDGIKLCRYQYLLIDVFAFMGVALLCLLGVIYLLFRLLIKGAKLGLKKAFGNNVKVKRN